MKFADVKEDDTLIADGGFTCIKEGAELIVIEDGCHYLYVPCDRGRHYQDELSCDKMGTLVGFRRN